MTSVNENYKCIIINIGSYWKNSDVEFLSIRILEKLLKNKLKVLKEGTLPRTLWPLPFIIV